MIKARTLGALVVLGLGACSQAAPITLINWDIETNASAKFGKIDGWGPNGGWADHAGFAKAGNETLGLNFGFYSAGTTETVGQLTSELIQANTTYKFWSFGQGGGDDSGTIPYQIGYAAVDGDLTSFVALNTNAVVVGAAWVETEGVTYKTGATGDEIGKQLIVRLGRGSDGGVSDVWFDSFQASAEAVPEPATLIGLGLGLAVLVRRKRK